MQGEREHKPAAPIERKEDLRRDDRVRKTTRKRSDINQLNESRCFVTGLIDNEQRDRFVETRLSRGAPLCLKDTKRQKEE